MNVLTQLSDEHDQLRAHLERIQAAAEAHDDQALRAALLAAGTSLADELDAHIALEEGEAFPAIAEALGEGLVVPFREEHREVRMLRDTVLAALTLGRAPHAAALRLCELILDHQQREDHMLFPSALEAVPAGRLDSSEG